jgi:hypothetical protein
MRWAGDVHTGVWQENQKYYEDLDINGGIILKCFLEKQGRSVNWIHQA